jgi:IS30 family transposase
MAKHKTFTVATNVKVYSVIRKVLGSAATTKTQTGFSDNTSPGEPTSAATQQSERDAIALRLNQLPRKTFGFEAPARRLRASVASTS